MRSNYAWSFWLAATFAIGFSSSSARAEEFPPGRGSYVGANDGDLLDYVCTETDGSRISCDFVQVLLASKSDQQKLEESLSDIPAILEEMKTETELCRSVEAIDRVRNGEVIDDEAFAAKIQKAIEIQALSDRNDPNSRENRQKINDAILALCRTPSDDSARNFLIASHEISAETCEPFFNRYSQTFVRVASGLWVAESSPSGECGIVNTSRFSVSPESPLLWNYEASKVITNKAGGEIIPCKGLDEKPQPYLWNQGPVYKNCKYMD